MFYSSEAKETLLTLWRVTKFSYCNICNLYNVHIRLCLIFCSLCNNRASVITPHQQRATKIRIFCVIIVPQLQWKNMGTFLTNYLSNVVPMCWIVNVGQNPVNWNWEHCEMNFPSHTLANFYQNGAISHLALTLLAQTFAPTPHQSFPNSTDAILMVCFTIVQQTRKLPFTTITNPRFTAITPWGI